MKWSVISLVLYMVGLLVFYHMADFSSQGWKNGYYIWDKGKDLLFITAIYFLTRRQRAVLVILLFSAIRFLWELVADVTQWDINNYLAINWLFILCLAAWVALLLKGRK